MHPDEARAYLRALLHKRFRITIEDGRLFVGEFICTDNQSNIILTGAYEYCPPSRKALQAAVEAAHSAATTVKADMTSRYLGQIVVPGKHITKIELDEATSTERQPTPDSEASTTAAI